jgi:hypothetical protein
MKIPARWLAACLLCLAGGVIAQLPGRLQHFAAEPPARPHADAGGERSASPASPEQSDILRAADCLENGDEVNACVHLARHLDNHPSHHEARRQYAELLLRIGKVDLARAEIVRFIIFTQDHGARFADDHIVCYRRLVEIAEMRDDAYEMHLSRGIALYLLAGRLERLPPDESELSAQGLLCKAAGDLAAAQLLGGGQVRPVWYSYLVWSRLGQTGIARRFLDDAGGAALLGDLTPAEQRDLAVAQRRREW